MAKIAMRFFSDAGFKWVRDVVKSAMRRYPCSTPRTFRKYCTPKMCRGCKEYEVAVGLFGGKKPIRYRFYTDCSQKSIKHTAELALLKFACDVPPCSCYQTSTCRLCRQWHLTITKIKDNRK